jgi:hypothetical protein
MHVGIMFRLTSQCHIRQFSRIGFALLVSVLGRVRWLYSRVGCLTLKILCPFDMRPPSAMPRHCCALMERRVVISKIN